MKRWYIDFYKLYDNPSETIRGTFQTCATNYKEAQQELFKWLALCRPDDTSGCVIGMVKEHDLPRLDIELPEIKSCERTRART